MDDTTRIKMKVLDIVPVLSVIIVYCSSYLNFNKIKNNLGFTIIIVHLESFSTLRFVLFDRPRIIGIVQ